jgi:hypothetical protein
MSIRHKPTTAAGLQLKTGEVHASASVATELLKLAQPPELQVLGYTLLQHLVSLSPPGSMQHSLLLQEGGSDGCLLHTVCLPTAQGCCRSLVVQVGNRWEEFSAEEHSQLGTLAYNMLQQGAAHSSGMRIHAPVAELAACLVAALLLWTILKHCCCMPN